MRETRCKVALKKKPIWDINEALSAAEQVSR